MTNFSKTHRLKRKISWDTWDIEDTNKELGNTNTKTTQTSYKESLLGL